MRHAARGIGLAERCLELAGKYTNERKTFSQKLSMRQGVQFLLVDAWMTTKMLRQFILATAARADAGEDIRFDSYMCKIAGDEHAFKTCDDALQVHGGIGLTTDPPLEKLLRDSRSMVITEGPSEILRMALSRAFYREYG